MSLPLPAGWGVATRAGDPPLCVAFRRYTLRDRLDAKRWHQGWRDGAAEGFPAGDLEAEELAAVCEAMAPRLLTWPSGEGWTDTRLRELRAQDAPAWGWLYGLLYAPAIHGAPAGLAQALQMAPRTDGGCPGDPATTDCETCLRVVYEPWRPAEGKLGRPVCEQPVVRVLGDAVCEMCPKWAIPGRPTLGAHDLELARLLRTTQVTGRLPDAGGILDQDGETWERLELIGASPWYAAVRDHLGGVDGQ